MSTELESTEDRIIAQAERKALDEWTEEHEPERWDAVYPDSAVLLKILQRRGVLRRVSETSQRLALSGTTQHLLVRTVYEHIGYRDL